jgi:hypothetical protein
VFAEEVPHTFDGLPNLIDAHAFLPALPTTFWTPESPGEADCCTMQFAVASAIARFEMHYRACRRECGAAKRHGPAHESSARRLGDRTAESRPP